MYSPRHSQEKNPASNHGQCGTQWMREAMESRQLIEDLKYQNEKLQRENHALNAKLNLVYEVCADMGVMDHVNDLMQQKIQQSLMPRGYPNPSTSRHSGTSTSESPTGSPRHGRQRFAASGDNTEGFICGSPSFQDTAAFPSSYEGLTKRENFRHRDVFALEESKYQDCDIFGKPKLASPSSSPTKSARLSYPTSTGDTIDELLDSARQEQFSTSYGRAYGHQ